MGITCYLPISKECSLIQLMVFYCTSLQCARIALEKSPIYVEFTVVSRRYIKLIIHLGFYYLSIPFVWGYWSNPFNIWLRCWILGIQILTQATLIPPLCIPLCWGCRFYSWPYRLLGQHGLWSSLYPLWFGTTPDSVPSFGDLTRPGVLQIMVQN